MKDRRVKKTRKAIHTAFAKLIANKDIQDITIKELCEEADINKSTFYLHFKDIYDCADDFMYDFVNKVLKIMQPYNFNQLLDNLPTIVDELLSIFKENQDIFMIFLRSPKHSFSINKIKHLTIEKILEKNENNQELKQMNEINISFIVCGILGIFEQNNFDEISSEMISALIYKIQNGFVESI